MVALATHRLSPRRAVVRLGGSPQDAHNEDIAGFAPREWAEVVAWMRTQLRLERSD